MSNSQKYVWDLDTLDLNSTSNDINNTRKTRGLILLFGRVIAQAKGHAYQGHAPLSRNFFKSISFQMVNIL